MSHAIRIHAHGGAEVLQWEEVAVPPPAAGEVTLRHEAIGINFIDTYQRSGLYPLSLPSGLGMEAAGVVSAVGAGVADLKEGDRVAYCSGPAGAYAVSRNIPARELVPLPAAISAETAAAIMLKGLTAQYLLRRTYRVQAGEPILFHAAAGGVGQIGGQGAFTDPALGIGNHQTFHPGTLLILREPRILTDFILCAYALRGSGSVRRWSAELPGHHGHGPLRPADSGRRYQPECGPRPPWRRVPRPFLAGLRGAGYSCTGWAG